MNELTKPKARTRELVVSELPDELLVYDLKKHKAFCLNNTAAAVWNICDGKRSVAEVASGTWQKAKRRKKSDGFGFGNGHSVGDQAARRTGITGS